MASTERICLIKENKVAWINERAQNAYEQNSLCYKEAISRQIIG